MSFFQSFFTRRRRVPRFSALPRRTRRRLALVCEGLTGAEDEMAQALGLPKPPRLMLVDEEEAVILLETDREGTL